MPARIRTTFQLMISPKDKPQLLLVGSHESPCSWRSLRSWRFHFLSLLPDERNAKNTKNAKKTEQT